LSQNIVIVGAGWAGLAAAVRLAGAGRRVTELESAPRPGGRARSMPGPRGGEPLDWGQHLFLGCYRETKALLGVLGTAGRLKPVRGPIAFLRAGKPGGSVSLLKLPSPLHLAGSFFNLSHLGLASRLQLGKMLLGFMAGRTGSAEDLERITVLKWLEKWGQGSEVLELFWRPLTVSALNEQPESAAASMMDVVLREGFFSGGADSIPELPDVTLGDLVAEPAKKFIETRGGEVRTRSRVAGLLARRGKVSAAVLKDGREVKADKFILAVPAWSLAGLLVGLESTALKKLRADLAAFKPSPIVTLFFTTDRKLFDGAYAGLLDGSFHWIFDRTGISGRGAGGFDYAMVCSAARSMEAMARNDIVRIGRTDLERHLPKARDMDMLRPRVIVDRKSTFSAVPCMTARRPAPDALAEHGIFLAGDWTDTGLPATLEGAVRSGFRCADLLMT
jgi:squalene-associated FAD-dependent desaturase